MLPFARVASLTLLIASGSAPCAASCGHTRPLPTLALVYRHERDERGDDHRVELRLSHHPGGRAGSPPPLARPLDLCAYEWGCGDAWAAIDEAERRFERDHDLEAELGRPVEARSLAEEGRIDALRDELDLTDARERAPSGPAPTEEE